MTKKSALWIFLTGTMSSAVLFLYLTFDTHRQVAALSHADKLSAEVIAGKWAFEKYNCNDCHTILGFGGYYAPDLTKVVRRVGEEGIKYRIKSPEKALEKSWRKMPDLKVSEAEITNLVAFFQWVGEINNGDWPPQDRKRQLTRGEEIMVAKAGISAGAAVYKMKGCMNCHSLHGEGGTFGASHDHIGRTMTQEQIERYIKNPKSVNPKAVMPPQTELSEKELEEVSKFLSGMK